MSDYSYADAERRHRLILTTHPKLLNIPKLAERIQKENTRFHINTVIAKQPFNVLSFQVKRRVA
jgi:hypothetical protein